MAFSFLCFQRAGSDHRTHRIVSARYAAFFSCLALELYVICCLLFESGVLSIHSLSHLNSGILVGRRTRAIHGVYDKDEDHHEEDESRGGDEDEHEDEDEDSDDQNRGKQTKKNDHRDTSTRGTQYTNEKIGTQSQSEDGKGKHAHRRANSTYELVAAFLVKATQDISLLFSLICQHLSDREQRETDAKRFWRWLKKEAHSARVKAITFAIQLWQEQRTLLAGAAVAALLAVVTALLVLLGKISRADAVDAGTAGLMMADCSSDIYMASFYYEHATERGERPIFFYISVTILGISSFLGAFYFMLEAAENIHNYFDKPLNKFFDACQEKIQHCCGLEDGGGVTFICIALPVYVLCFLAILPFGMALPIGLWIYTRFFQEKPPILKTIDEMKELLEKRQSELPDLSKNRQAEKVTSDQRMKRMTDHQAKIKGVDDKILDPAVYSTADMKKLRDEFTRYANDFERADQDANEAAQLTEAIAEMQTQLRRAQNRAYNTFNLGGYRSDALDEYRTLESRLSAFLAKKRNLETRQDTIFKSEGLGCWISGYHVNKIMEVAQALEEKKGVQSFTDFFVAFDPNSRQALENKLKSLREQERLTMYAFCTKALPIRLTLSLGVSGISGTSDYPGEYKLANDEKNGRAWWEKSPTAYVYWTGEAWRIETSDAASTGTGDGPIPTTAMFTSHDERPVLTPEEDQAEKETQEEIVARFASVMDPEIDAAQADLNEVEGVKSELEREEKRLIKPFQQQIKAIYAQRKGRGISQTQYRELVGLREQMAQVTIEVTDKLQKVYPVYDDRKGRLRKAQEQKDKWTRVLSKGFDEADLKHRLQELNIKALSNHIQGLEISYKLNTHTAFYMETVSEAIPQSLLQTSALVIYSRQGLHCTKNVCKAVGKAAKRIDYVSLFSITMSLGSIMSKLYVFCKSPIDKVFQYKFCLCCHDVALVFYTISALFQMHAESDDAVHVFFLTRPVDMYAAMWCWQAFVLTTMVFLTGWILLICILIFFVVDTSLKDGCSPSSICGMIFVGLVFIVTGCVSSFVLLAPIMIVMQTLRLSVQVIYFTGLENIFADEDNDQFDSLTFLTYTFLSNKINEGEERAAYKAIEWAIHEKGDPTEADQLTFHRPDTWRKYFRRLRTQIEVAWVKMEMIRVRMPKFFKEKSPAALLKGMMDEDTAFAELLDEQSDDGEEADGVVGVKKKALLKNCLAGTFLAGCALWFSSMFVIFFLGVLYGILYPFLSFGNALAKLMKDNQDMEPFQTMLAFIYFILLGACLHLRRHVHRPYNGILNLLMPRDLTFLNLMGRVIGLENEELGIDTDERPNLDIDLKDLENVFNKYFCKSAGDQILGRKGGCFTCCLSADDEEGDEYAGLPEDDEAELAEQDEA